MEDMSEFILEEFARAGISYKPYHEEFLVSCPWHTTKSWKKKLNIHKSGSKIHCWVCGHGGNWNTYAEVKGLKKITLKEKFSPEIGALAQEIEELERDKNKKPIGLLPWSGTWRGLNEKFLKSIPSYRWYDIVNKPNGNRIVWPITIRNKIVGYTSAKLENEKITSKYNFPGLKAKKYVFPYDHPLITDCVILVEGVFDALRLINEGIPAWCIFGTTNWSESKIPLLINHRIKRVLLMFDGDEAGFKAINKAYNDLAELFDTKIFQCPEGTDPGDIPEKYLKIARRLLDL